MFRISRMISPVMGEAEFKPREIRAEERPWHVSWVAPEKNIMLLLRFLPEASSGIADWFDPEEIEMMPDGSAFVRTCMADTPWIDGFVLGFGACVELLEPACIRERIRKTVCKLASDYST